MSTNDNSPEADEFIESTITPYTEDDLRGVISINAQNNGCQFDPDYTIQVSGRTAEPGTNYDSPRIKNKDRVGLIGFRVVQGRVKVVVEYHKAGWKNGADLIIGMSDEAKDICWRNPHHNTPDVRVRLEFLDSPTQISSFTIHFRND